VLAELRISLTEPVGGAIFSSADVINIKANAGPEEYVDRVIFYADDLVLGADTEAPWELSWTDAEAGEYKLTAIVRDAAGTVRISQPVPITIQPSASVKLLLPRGKTQFAIGSPVELSAEISDPNSEVKQVNYYVDGTFVGSSSSAPWSFTWSDGGLGAHVVKAEAVDENGVAVAETTAIIEVQPGANALFLPYVMR
jgi:hypothetical protein